MEEEQKNLATEQKIKKAENKSRKKDSPYKGRARRKIPQKAMTGRMRPGHMARAEANVVRMSQQSENKLL